MKLLELRKNKKGIMGVVFFFLILFTILIIGFIGVMVVAGVDFASDTITPIMQDIGVVGEANVSDASRITFGTVDTLVQALPWLLTFSYVAMLIFSIIFVVSYQFNPHPAYIGIYFLFVVLLIFGAVIMSNMYENIHQSGDVEIGGRIREQQSMSFLIIHSPAILTVIAFIVGIYIFAGNKDNAGGFDI
jgi:hypothetical protein